ncbi:carboxylesterase family protein [Aurantivibrio plasticivorans]
MITVFQSTRLLVVALLVTVLASCACPFAVKPTPNDVVAGQVTNRTYDFKEAGKPMSYALYVPSSYDGSQKMPLMILLHGLTSNPNAVIGYEGITQEAEKRGIIVVAPYGYNEGGWYGSRGKGKDFGDKTANMFTKGAPENLGELSELDVLNVFDIIQDEFRIDQDRMYVVGHSMGGAGTVHFGTKYHKQWAAIAMMSPAVFVDPPEPISNLKDIPVMIVHGDKDELVPVDLVREFYQRVSDTGTITKYMEIPDGDHVKVISRNPEMITEVFDFLTSYSN